MKIIKFILLIILFTSRLSYTNNLEITVAVAANVQYAMRALKTEFEKETGIKAEIIVGSSGLLTAQIQQGAPYDVFISADMKYPNTLYKSKMAIDSPRVYAFGSLVIWTLKKGIKLKKDFTELLNNNIHKIALANPRIAPYGVATIQALKYFGIYDRIKDKLIYGESISPTNQYIVSKAADIGFTAKSVVMAPIMMKKGKWLEVNPSAYNPIKQGCVILKYGFDNHKKESELFYNFLFSKKAKKILMKYGYKVVDNK
ncbi:MAG TPA: molybdate ABC transporter substrate-binding protein [Ignavibacteria bacterium]|nr:molybdate ABC transporter substrate-binding protein [Ignavibacteria bacterium]